MSMSAIDYHFVIGVSGNETKLTRIPANTIHAAQIAAEMTFGGAEDGERLIVCHAKTGQTLCEKYLPHGEWIDVQTIF